MAAMPHAKNEETRPQGPWRGSRRPPWRQEKAGKQAVSPKTRMNSAGRTSTSRGNYC